MALGVLLRKIKMLGVPTLNQLNVLAFKIFLSVSLYYNICTADIATVFDGKLLAFALLSQLAVLMIALLFALPSERTKKRRGALAHGIFHTNFVIFGTLIGTALCGEGNLGSISLLIATVVPAQNVLSVILLELYREGGKLNSKKIFGGIIKNPYVIAALLGFATQLLGVHYPPVLLNIFRDIGRCATPVALIVMGGLFNFGAIHQNLKSICIGTFTRLIAVPSIMVPIAVWIGFRGADMVGLMCIFIAPCATSSFTLASVMDSDADLTAQLVLFTSIFSLATIFCWIFGLSQIGVLV
jgi:predicted permease|nr:AEC family transporter [Anaerotruncus rubiinfantis]